MTDRVGQQLGNYRLTRLVGRGGFADVYLGDHIYLKTPAAIKVLQTRLTSESDLESFLNEARTVAHLTHSHIVRVLDFGVHEEVPFLVMDYAPNGTLRQRHAKGSQLPLATITAYVKQIAEALQYAHDEKIIHRDIKPENMLLNKHNNVLLSDFGIALIAQSSRYQSTQDVIGTVAYMSPEQIQGRPRSASDQYSLAIVTYEWLCGDRPFHGSFTELCAQHMFAPPPPLKDKIPNINPAIEQVVTIALAKDPKQRFGSVRAFANALEQATQGISVSPSLNETQLAATEKASSLNLTPAKEAPPIPPTRAAKPAQQQNRNYQQASNNPQLVTPPSQQHLSSQPSANVETPLYLQAPMQSPVVRRKSGWRIGKREGLAILASLIITALSGALVGSTYPLSDNPPLFILYDVLYSTLWLFFAGAFGPWLGLFAAINNIAFFCTFALTFYSHDSSIGENYGSPISYLTSIVNWHQTVALGIMGFLVGLVVLKTRGRYTSLQSFALVSSVSFIVQVLIFFIFNELDPYFIIHSNILLESALSSLVLLPIALFIYSRIVSRRQQRRRA